MHYKCHLFMNKVPDAIKVEDILKPFKRSDDADEYSSNVVFVYDWYDVGGRYSVWNGGVMKLKNLKHFAAPDCFIVMDENGNAVTRDSFFALPGRNNEEFDSRAWEMYERHKKDGYVVVLDICTK